MIQIRNVPDTLHRRLKSRAALAGMSLSDYLLHQIREVAERPTIEEMRSRFRAALAEVPALAEHTHTIEATLAAAAKADWPAFQRVHGDYHLGQVLEVPERGWVLLDFEGEPLRPLAERNRTDQPLRDVAGMLRSFDYAGGSIEQQTRGVSARDWVSAAQDAFLDGYARVAGHDPRRVARPRALSRVLLVHISRNVVPR